jgi:hypothetical protein
MKRNAMGIQALRPSRCLVAPHLKLHSQTAGRLSGGGHSRPYLDRGLYAPARRLQLWAELKSRLRRKDRERVQVEVV